MGRIWAVCSGSGGVGKSTLAVMLSLGAVKQGKTCILLDASGASRSCDLMLGLESVVVLDVLDVIRSQIRLDDALYPVPNQEGFRFACASLYDDVSVSDLAGMTMILRTLCDVLVVDLPTGQGSLGRGAFEQSDERILVTRPDDASMRATERLMMRKANDGVQNSLVINRMSSERVKKRMQYSTETVEAVLDMVAQASIPEDTKLALGQKRIGEMDGPVQRACISLVKNLLTSI